MSGICSIASYNERTSSAKSISALGPKYSAMAQSATDPAEKQRYETAAKDAAEVSKLIESQAREIAISLGIDDSMYGKIIPPEVYDDYVKNGKQSNHSLLGRLISLKT